jgi:hypothetical protein
MQASVRGRMAAFDFDVVTDVPVKREPAPKAEPERDATARDRNAERPAAAEV